MSSEMPWELRKYGKLVERFEHGEKRLAFQWALRAWEKWVQGLDPVRRRYFEKIPLRSRRKYDLSAEEELIKEYEKIFWKYLGAESSFPIQLISISNEGEEKCPIPPPPPKTVGSFIASLPREGWSRSFSI